MTITPAPAPPRLRIVVARYGEKVVGGAERLSRLLATRLCGRGWDVEVRTTCAIDERTWANVLTPGQSWDAGVAVVRHPVRLPRHHLAFAQLSRGFWRLPARARPELLWVTLQGPWSPSLEAALTAQPAVPTLFVSYLYWPTIAGLPRVRGPRLMLPTAHDEMPLRLRAVGRALTTADGLWYATPEERDIVETAHPAAAAVPGEVGNVGVEAPSDVDTRRFAIRHGLSGPYLLYGGRATAGKGVEDLVAGLRKLRATGADATLVLTGEAGERVPPEPGIVPAGMLDDAERWDAIAGASAVVVPSHHESLSILALEGWAVSRPALLNAASPVLAGQAERSGGALTFRGSDELAVRAASLLADPALAAALGRAGRAFVTRTYGWDAVVARLERLLDGAREAARRRADGMPQAPAAP